MKFVSSDWFASYGGGKGGSLTETTLKKERQTEKKKLNSTYIFFSAFRLNLCFRSVSFAKTNMVTDY